LTNKISLLGPNSGTTTKPGEQSFAETLRALGRLVPEGSKPDAIVFVDFDNDPAEEVASHLGASPAGLIRQEPRVVRPQNYRPDFLSQMSFVIDVGRPPGSASSQVNWPQDWNLKILENSRTEPSVRIDKTVMINRNLMSFVAGEMYSLRRLLAQRSSEIDVWGMGWQMPFINRAIRVIEELIIPLGHGFPVKLSSIRGWFKRPRSYKGPSEDKLATLATYKYSLVIENSLDYMSEKLFDCLFAGTLPIYVGPDPSEFGIPEFAAVHAKPNIESVMESIDLARGINLEEWRSSVLAWLSSEGVEQMWSGPYVLRQILEKVDSELLAIKKL
jgi:hypothetical protein